MFMSPRFLYEIFTNSQVSGVVFFDLVVAMTLYYILCHNPSLCPLEAARRPHRDLEWLDPAPSIANDSHRRRI
jgi:hypothetical protein